MEEQFRKLKQRSNLLSSRIDNHDATAMRKTPQFIQNLAFKSRFGEEEPQDSQRNTAQMFMVGDGIDTTGLMKLLEEGKSKLVCTNTSSVSDHDVEGHIRQYHERAVMSTLEESESIFEEVCTSKIWEMMNGEFLKACSNILEAENLHNPYITTTQTATNLPLATRKLVTPPITTVYSKEDDVSKIYVYEAVLKTLFDDLSSGKNLSVSEKLLSALQNSHQDMAGEVFVWRLLIAQLNLNQVPRDHYRKEENWNEKKSLFNSLQFLQDEFIGYMRRTIVRSRSIQQLPEDDLVSVVRAYVSVIFDGQNTKEYDKDGQAFLPLWPQLFCLLRSGCTLDHLSPFRDDILRYGGSVGNDILHMLEYTIRLFSRDGAQPMTAHEQGMTQRLRGMCNRLCGAGDLDMHKILLLSLLSKENPYIMNSVTTPHSNEMRVPQQEVLMTFQDWLWHKLITIFVNDSQQPPFKETSSDFQLAGLHDRICECGADYFDTDGQNPFGYIQSLLVVGQYEQAVLYLLQKHWLISAVFLAMILYVYGVVKGSQNVFIITLNRLLPHLREKPLVMAHLIAFVREPSLKLDLLVMLLINSPNAEQLLVGVMQDTGIRSPGCFDSIRDVNVNEVIKNAAVQLNTNNEWRRAVALFKLCNNWDHAADLLTTHLAQFFMEHNSNWREVLLVAREFKDQAEKSARRTISMANMHNLSVLLDMMYIFELVNNNEFDQCLHFLSEINFLPQNEDPQSVYAAINAMKGIKNCICMLIPEVILAACTCIGYKYNEAKQCLYVAVSENEKREFQMTMQQFRSRITAYEQFVGLAEISVPPAVNEKLSHIVISMS